LRDSFIQESILITSSISYLNRNIQTAEPCKIRNSRLYNNRRKLLEKQEHLNQEREQKIAENMRKLTMEYGKNKNSNNYLLNKFIRIIAKVHYLSRKQ